MEDLHPAVERLLRRIRERAGESIRSGDDAIPLMQRTTPSLEALALISSRYRSPDLGDYVADLRYALELDPDFAKAKALVKHD